MLANSGDLELRSRRVVTPEGERCATVKVRGGIIVEIGEYGDVEADGGVPAATHVGGSGQAVLREDLGSLAILPGLVDPHVHLNEPGRTDWEGFATGTAAAAAGGVTTIVDMPLNSSPVTTSVAALAAKRKSAVGKLHVDVGFYAGLVPGNEGEIGSLLEAGVLGVKAFLCDSGLAEFPAATERELWAAMPQLVEHGVPLLAHAERETRVATMNNPRCYADYLATRPPTFERRAIELLIRLCRETGCRTHIVHLSDAGSLAMLRDARQDGLPITVETCPHYLTFAAEEIADGATPFKCAPPIRDRANREALWQGLAAGIIDFVASDHSPCPPRMKRLDDGRFDLAWGGISSLQLGLSAVWTEAAKRGYSLSNVVDWLSHRGAQFLRRDVGLRPGAPANLVVFNPDDHFVVRGGALHHRHAITPYEGRSLRGVVLRSYLRGKRTGSQQGKMI